LQSTMIPCVAFRLGTPTSRSLGEDARRENDHRRCAGAMNGTVSKHWFRKAGPGQMRFAQFETKAVQRRKLDPAPVSEVRPPRLNAFETKRKRPPTGASSRVRYKIMAEGMGFEPTIQVYPV